MLPKPLWYLIWSSIIALESPQVSALSLITPQDLYAHPRFQIVLSKDTISNATALDILAAEPTEGVHRHLMRANTGQAFLCSVPKPVPTSAAAPYRPLNVEEREERRRRSLADKKAGLERGLALLEPLKNSCLYYRLGWFTYSFCHGSEIRQFHEVRAPGSTFPAEDPNAETYTLGQYAHQTTEIISGTGGGALRDVLAREGPIDDEFGNEQRYLVQRWSGGTLCDKTGTERKVEVQFHCNTQSTDRIALIRETSICEYILVIHTPRLCGEPAFLANPEHDQSRNAVTLVECQPIANEQPLLAPPPAPLEIDIEPSLTTEDTIVGNFDNFEDLKKVLSDVGGEGTQVVIVGEDEDDSDRPAIHHLEDLTEAFQKTIEAYLKQHGIGQFEIQTGGGHLADLVKRLQEGGTDKVRLEEKPLVPKPQFVGSADHRHLAKVYASTFEEKEESETGGRKRDEL